MSDEQNNEERVVDVEFENVAPEATEVPEVEVPAQLRDVDPAKLAALKDKLAAFIQGKGKTESGSEAPVEQQSATQVSPSMSDGRNVDWNEYDLDFSVRHLYPRASFRPTPQGPKWVAMVDEFYSTTRNGKSHGRKVNVPGTVDGIIEESLNLGEYLNDMTLRPEGWKIAALLPGPSGDVNVLLQRPVPYVLPDPIPLKRETEVEVSTDEELQTVEDAALQFAADEGLAAPPIEDTETPPVGLDEKPTLGIEPGTLERVNLELNAPATIPAPVPAGDPLNQPLEAAIDEDRRTGFPRAPGVENIRQGLSKLEDFGEVN